MSAWSDSVDASLKFTAARMVGNPRRYLVWISQGGTNYAPREYEASSARQAEDLARAEIARVETIIGTRI